MDFKNPKLVILMFSLLNLLGLGLVMGIFFFELTLDSIQDMVIEGEVTKNRTQIPIKQVVKVDNCVDKVVVGYEYYDDLDMSTMLLFFVLISIFMKFYE